MRGVRGRCICRVEIYTIVLLGQFGKLPYAYLRLSTRKVCIISLVLVLPPYTTLRSGNAALRRAPSARSKSYVMNVLIG